MFLTDADRPGLRTRGPAEPTGGSLASCSTEVKLEPVGGECRV